MIIKSNTNKFQLIQELHDVNNNGRFDILDKHDYIIDFTLYLLTLYNNLDVKMVHIGSNLNYIISIPNPDITIYVEFNTNIEVIINLSWTKTRMDRTIINWRNRITKKFEELIKDKKCTILTNGKLDGNTYNRIYYIKN